MLDSIIMFNQPSTIKLTQTSLFSSTINTTLAIDIFYVLLLLHVTVTHKQHKQQQVNHQPFEEKKNQPFFFPILYDIDFSVDDYQLDYTLQMILVC